VAFHLDNHIHNKHSVPASIDFGGGAMTSSTNYILIELNMIFTFIALITTVKFAFGLFVKK